VNFLGPFFGAAGPGATDDDLRSHSLPPWREQREASGAQGPATQNFMLMRSNHPMQPCAPMVPSPLDRPPAPPAPLDVPTFYPSLGHTA